MGINKPFSFGPLVSSSSSSSSKSGENALEFRLLSAGEFLRRVFVLFETRGFCGVISSKSSLKALPPGGIFIGVASSNDSLSGSFPASSSQSRDVRFPKRDAICEVTRGRFSLTGEGETGSPRSRLRARVTGVGVLDM